MGLLQPSEGRGLLGDRLSSCLIFEVCYRPESATHFQSSVDPSEVDARTRRRVLPHCRLWDGGMT